MSKYKIYKKNVLENLNQLASYDLQKLTWFPNDQGLASSFYDDVSYLFDDFHLEEALYSGEIIFNKNADQVLRELNEICDAIGYDRLDVELIDSPEMQLVREKAAKALVLIQASDYSESTVDIVE